MTQESEFLWEERQGMLHENKRQYNTKGIILTYSASIKWTVIIAVKIQLVGQKYRDKTTLAS